MILGSVRSQHQNLGDLVIRRNMVHWLKDLDDVRLIVGDMPEGFIAALEVPDEIRLYRSLRGALLAKPIRHSSSLIFAPGEQSIEDKPRVVAAALANGLFAAYAKASGGSVVKLGRGFKGSGTLSSQIERGIARISDAVYVRDAEAPSVVRGAQLMPDIALWGGVSSTRRLADPFGTTGDRQGVAVSMRFDRGEPPSAVRRLVPTLAALEKGPIVVPVQVELDAGHSMALADSWGAELVPWVGDHATQLRRVEETYDRVRFVVSDRLHVLLFGLLRGAIPVGVETGRHEKLARQLRPIGLDSLVFPLADVSDGLADTLVALLPANQDLCARALVEAQRALDITREEVRTLLDSPSQPSAARPVRDDS